MAKFLENNIIEILDASFNLSNQAIYWLDKNGRFLYANENALQGLNYTLEELQQINLWDVDSIVNTKEKYLKSIEKFSVEGSNDNSNVFETLHIKKNGESFPVEVVSKIKTIGGKQYVLSYAKDISHRLKRTQKINLYFELINSSKDMIFFVDIETQRVEYANKIVYKNLGYSIDELKKMKISEIREPFEDDKRITIPEVFEEIKEKKNLVTFGIYIAKDGSKIPVETSVQLKNYLGKSFITAISRDIRERIEIENKKEDLNCKLKEYNRTLQHEISKVKKELIEYEIIMKKQSKMAAMGEMIENIAHQWRQPLSGVSVLASGMILQNEEGILDKELLNSGLNTINEQVQYLSKTIDDFRNFFKPDKEKNIFKVKDLVENAIKLIKSRFNSFSIIFIKELEDLSFLTYENELLQVVLNIISNSVDELIRKKSKKIVSIKSYRNENSFIIEIKDSAGGIDENIIDRIFEPYFTTKHKYQGTGIGLYMSKNIMKHLQGKIEASNDILEYENRVYEGACFKIILPLSIIKKDENG